ncbi:DUF4386 domain-containing protein [Bacillus horti]|nr:DUF4386 domain-containing protein [Bacillus horti]
MTRTGNGLTSQRKVAIVAGSALMVMVVAAAFSFGFAHTQLFVAGDGEATFHNLISQSGLFKAEIFGWIIILVSDIVVACACYILLKPVSKHLSLLGAGFRLTYSAILGIAIMNLLLALLVANSADYVASFTTAQLGAQVLFYFHAFESIWSVGLLIFGGHLLILGLLAFKADGIPNWIAILLLFAAGGYVVLHSFELFFNEYEAILSMLNTVLVVPMTVGELSFGLWLLFKGGKKPVQKQNSATASL